jgi:nicotinamidase-related amidase
MPGFCSLTGMGGPDPGPAVGVSFRPLDITLRNMGVTTCVVSGVTTCVCVATTVRGAVEHNYRMILVKDAVAEVSRETHEAELKTMARVFADVTTAEVEVMLTGRRRISGRRATD